MSLVVRETFEDVCVGDIRVQQMYSTARSEMWIYGLI